METIGDTRLLYLVELHETKLAKRSEIVSCKWPVQGLVIAGNPEEAHALYMMYRNGRLEKRACIYDDQRLVALTADSLTPAQRMGMMGKGKTSARKKKTSRANGKLGGRPRLR